ncbi:Tartrate-resistant acid phosphatase type 5 [Aphelenchoides bicaudatus]|nr:Tartrate-resistant acid phosphatase type 5 [Aphelenchoides bicaudatus]
MSSQQGRKWLVFACTFTFIFAVNSSLVPSERIKCTQGTICAVNKNSLDFFVIGDTGGISLDVGDKFLNFIQPTEIQARTANVMANVAAKNGQPDFVVNVGDNVYWSGVDNVIDQRFETVFENVYDKDNLLVPFYMIAGNHDWLGNVTAQVLYTNYSNTIVLCGNSVDVDGRSIIAWMNARKQVPNKPDPPNEKLAEEQWQWIEEQLKQSRADYLFVVGHYPIHSISAHGPVKCLADKLDPLLRKYQVTAYFSGHDHSMQLFRSENPGSANPMYYIVSGVGSRKDYSTKHMADDGESLVYHWPRQENIPWWKFWRKYTGHIGYGWGGFARFHLEHDQATAQFYVDEGGNLEHQEVMKATLTKDI